MLCCCQSYIESVFVNLFGGKQKENGAYRQEINDVSRIDDASADGFVMGMKSKGLDSRNRFAACKETADEVETIKQDKAEQ